MSTLTVVTQRVPSEPLRGLRALIKEARQRQRRRQLLLALVLIVAASAGGISYATSSGASGSRSAAALARSGAAFATAPSSKPCSLLTNAQVAQVLGAPVQTRAKSSGGSCTWLSSAMGYMETRESFDLSVVARVSRASFVSAQERLRIAEPQFAPVPVAGIGDVAYVSPNWDTLSAWKDGYIIEIDSPSLSARPNTAERLARIVLKRF